MRMAIRGLRWRGADRPRHQGIGRKVFMQFQNIRKKCYPVISYLEFA